MAMHSSILAWRIPGTEEPGGLPSMGLHKVGHDWSDLVAAAAAKWACDSISTGETHINNKGKTLRKFLMLFSLWFFWLQDLSLS